MRGAVFAALDELSERRRSYVMLGQFERAKALPTRVKISAKERKKIWNQAILDAASFRSLIERTTREALAGSMAATGQISRAQAAATIDGSLSSFLEEPGQDLESFIQELINPIPVEGSEEYIEWEKANLKYLRILNQRKKALKAGNRSLALKKQYEMTEVATAWSKSYNQGIYESSLNASDVGMLTYSAILDGRACPRCREFDGTTLPKRHPWWETYTPPIHHRCRCRVVSLTWDQIDELGIEVSKRLPTSIDRGPGKDPIPAVPDPGFGGDGTRIAPLLRVRVAPGRPGPPVVPTKTGKVPKTVPSDKLTERGSFVPAKTVQDAESWAVENGVPFANYSRMDIEMANSINRSLASVPRNARPDYIGFGGDFKRVTGFKLQRKMKTWYGVSLKPDSITVPGRMRNRVPDSFEIFETQPGNLVLSPAIGKGRQPQAVAFSSAYRTPKAITERKALLGKLYKKKHGRDWWFNKTGELIPAHEFGHVFYDRSRLGGSWEPLAKRWHREANLGILENSREAFAEAFASFFMEGGDKLPGYIREYFTERVR